MLFVMLYAICYMLYVMLRYMLYDAICYMLYVCILLYHRIAVLPLNLDYKLLYVI